MKVLVPLFVAAAFVCPLHADDVAMTPLAPLTMAEMARSPESQFYAERNFDRESHLRPFAAQSLSALHPAPAVFATKTPPPAATGFRAFTATVPPADSGGAVSARFCVSVNNDSVVVQDRSGKQLSRVGMSQFWSDPSLPPALLTDPRIIYDAKNDRFITVAIYIGASQGKLLIAFTASGDPTATWKRFFATFDDSGTPGDFPNIGQTSDAILITADDFDGTSGYIFVMPKTYDTTTPLQRIHLGTGYDLVPVTTSGSTRRFVRGSVTGTMVELTGSTYTTKLFSASASTQINNTLTCGTQLGSLMTLDCGVGDLEAAVEHDGVTWAVLAAERGVIILRITDAETKTYTIESPDMTVAYSSIAVNRAGAVLVAYSVFSPTGYPSAGYSYIDPAGNLSAPAILKRGEGAYTGHYRWGDYTTAVVDPADNTSFWTVQLYASPATSSWATWWGYIKIADNAPARRHAAAH
jgi:hypothetical protein